MTRLIAILLAALMALPAAADKPAAATPRLGPDFSQMLDEISPGLIEGYPTVVDLSLPPLVPVEGEPLDIDIGARSTTTAVEVSPTVAALGPIDTTALGGGWVVNINTAPVHVLVQLPHFDARRAEAVVAFREANGPFQRRAQICDVFGITQEMYLDLAPHLVCEGPTIIAPPLASR